MLEDKTILELAFKMYEDKRQTIQEQKNTAKHYLWFNVVCITALCALFSRYIEPIENPSTFIYVIITIFCFSLITAFFGLVLGLASLSSLWFGVKQNQPLDKFESLKDDLKQDEHATIRHICYDFDKVIKQQNTLINGRGVLLRCQCVLALNALIFTAITTFFII